MVSKYRVDISAQLMELGEDGRVLPSYNGPQGVKIADNTEVEVADFGELLSVFMALHTTSQGIRGNTEFLAKIRSQTGKEPCNCIGDGWHVHMAERELAAIDASGCRWVKVFDPGAAAETAAEAAAPADSRPVCQCGERADYARFDQAANGDLFICPNSHEILKPRFDNDGQGDELVTDGIPLTAMLGPDGRDSGQTLIGNRQIGQPTMMGQPTGAPIPR